MGWAWSQHSHLVKIFIVTESSTTDSLSKQDLGAGRLTWKNHDATQGYAEESCDVNSHSNTEKDPQDGYIEHQNLIFN